MRKGEARLSTLIILRVLKSEIAIATPMQAQLALPLLSVD